jgi:ADP-ribosylglycohydrolase
MDINDARRDAVRGAFLGVCIGDALGMPVETLSHERILELTDGKGIDDFVVPLQFRIEDTQGLKAGSTTDDWQLTHVVARSILECRGFDMRHCAQEHVLELGRSVFGWGKTSIRSIEAIRDGVRDLSLPPQEFGNKAGCGNGVIMKVVPLAVFHAFRPEEGLEEQLFRDVLALGWITHPDIRAGLSAYAVASLFVAILREDVSDYESGRVFLERTIDKLKAFEQIYDESRAVDQCVSGRLSVLLQAETLSSAEALRKSSGCGFMALDTVAFVWGVFLRHPDDFRAAILEAVNAGGDADTNASIVGALVGANVGARGIPERWSSFNPDFSEAERLARAFCELAESRS